MKLDNFISETLNSVIKGIKDSQDFAKENGARINPNVGKWDYDKTRTIYLGKEKEASIVSTIDFDVAISSSNEQENGLKGGVNVMSLNFGGNLSDKDISSIVSRIKFSIDIVLPSVEP
jgi:hypothetical protein